MNAAGLLLVGLWGGEEGECWLGWGERREGGRGDATEHLSQLAAATSASERKNRRRREGEEDGMMQD